MLTFVDVILVWSLTRIMVTPEIQSGCAMEAPVAIWLSIALLCPKLGSMWFGREDDAPLPPALYASSGIALLVSLLLE